MKTKIISYRVRMLLMAVIGFASTLLPGQVLMKSGTSVIDHRVKKGGTVKLEIREYRGTLQWQQSVNGTTWLDWAGKTGTSVQFLATEEGYFRVAVTSENCDPVPSATVHIITYQEPTVVTAEITNLTPTEAQCGGTVTDDGNDPVTARGVCWSTHQNPTITDSMTIDGTGSGSYASYLTGLIPGTTYYVRAYATNIAGTVYGSQKQFAFHHETGTFTDTRDNRTYPWVRISNQTWMAQNLAFLPAVSPPATGSETDINYYVYDYDGTNMTAAKAHANYTTYGVLYNWPAAMASCPPGWHLPIDAEWTILTDYLIDKGFGYEGSGDDIAKSMSSISGWTPYSLPGVVGNDQASNNLSGFMALPGGSNYDGEGFRFLGEKTFFWSASEYESLDAWSRSWAGNSKRVVPVADKRRNGYSVRCMMGVVAPKVITTAITDSTSTTVTGGGNVISDGGASITARGICCSTSQNPTISDSKTTNGTGMGTYTSNLTGLAPGTRYFMRAYATNSVGTGYGGEVSFTTRNETGIFKDSRDTTTYSWVKIGTQTWMAGNLAYLPAVSPAIAGSDATASYYVQGYEGTTVTAAKATANYTTYGVLYNWIAATTACPSGWHLPSDGEWKVLETYLGMSPLDANSEEWRESGSIGTALKFTLGWNLNGNGDNRSGFAALPGGYRHKDGFFVTNLVTCATLWSASKYGLSSAWSRDLASSRAGVNRLYYNISYGCSVRCLRD